MAPADSVDIGALTDLCTPWCIHVAATLRVADHMAAGLTRIEDLAGAAQADAESLQRVLRHLVSRGIFEEHASGQFALNEAARPLLDPSLRIGLDLEGIGGRMAHGWGTLLAAVRTGKPAYHTLFGRPFWDDLEAHPAVAESFDELMGPGHGTPDPDVLVTTDWDAIRTVVDVGGGTGSMLVEILRAHPAIRGILVDRPSTVARAASVFHAAGVAGRVTRIGQSFFEPLPAGADLYLLKNVLADWPDDEAGALLTRCAEAARPGGRIVVLGGITPAGERPSPELLMMVLVGGKSRTLAEFECLGHTAGLHVAGARRQSSGRVVVECRPSP
jgi:2,7-dihydroxy-5-methyl-1-naphthoate 7-O-methyltransferase